jgi:TRAP-type C4-dicarboxylate transport system permease small subunit
MRQSSRKYLKIGLRRGCLIVSAGFSGALMRLLRKFIKNFDLILASTAFCLSIVIITINVLLRYVFSKPIVEAEELSALGFVWIIFVGAAAVYRQHGNISIDVLINIFPLNIYKIFTLVTRLILLVVNLYVTYLAFGLFESGWEKTTFVLRLPYTFFYVAIFLGYGLMSIYAIRDLSESIKSTSVKKAS